MLLNVEVELLDTSGLGTASQQIVHGGSIVAHGDAVEIGEEVLRTVEQVERLVLLLEGRLDTRIVVD